MTDVLHKPGVVNAFDFKTIVKRVIEENEGNIQDIVSFGLEKEFDLKTPKPIRLCLYSNSSSGDSFILHYGAGVCNKITVWVLDSGQSAPRKALASKSIDHRLLRLVYIPNSVVYVAACADMKIRTLDRGFNDLAALELFNTILDLIYCESLGVIIACGVGFVKVLELGQCLQEPPTVRGEIKLTSTSNSTPWIFQMHVNPKTQTILAACHEAIYFITWESLANLTCSKVFENRQSQSLSAVVEYRAKNIIITGMAILFTINFSLVPYKFFLIEDSLILCCKHSFDSSLPCLYLAAFNISP